MKLKHLGISALALGLVVGGGASLSAFASASKEVNTNEAKMIHLNGTDELPEGVMKKDKIQADPNDTNVFKLDGTDELPEGVYRVDEVQNGEIKN